MRACDSCRTNNAENASFKTNNAETPLLTSWPSVNSKTHMSQPPDRLLPLQEHAFHTPAASRALVAISGRWPVGGAITQMHNTDAFFV